MKRILIILVLSLFLAQFSFAEESDAELSGGKRYLAKSCQKFNRALKSINLSDTQKEDVKTTLNEYLDETSSSKIEEHKERRELFKVLHTPLDNSEDYDSEAVSTAYQEFTDLRELVILSYAELMVDFQQILNSQQYKRFVKSRVHFIRCTDAPEKIVRRKLKQWIE